MDASGMPNPFREAPAHNATPGVGSKDLMRLYVMGVVLIFVVGAMFLMSQHTLEKPEGAEEGKGKTGLTVRQDPPEGRPQAVPGPDDPPKEKKKIDIEPLPKDGKVDLKALAAPFVDGTEKPVKETREFVTLLTAFLNSVTPERLAEETEKDLTADGAYLEPDQWRGVPMEAYGRLIMIYTERIDATTPDNVEVVYLGAMQEYITNRTILFYLPEYPVDENGDRVEFAHYIKRGQRFYTNWVRVQGIFLRQYDYPSQVQDENGRDRWARSALLMAKTLRKAKAPENLGDPRGPFLFVVLGLGVVIAAVVVIAGVMSRKHSTGSMRLKMVQLKKAKGLDVFPKPDPSKQVLGDEIPRSAGSSEPPKSSGPEDPSTSGGTGDSEPPPPDKPA